MLHLVNRYVFMLMSVFSACFMFYSFFSGIQIKRDFKAMFGTSHSIPFQFDLLPPKPEASCISSSEKEISGAVSESLKLIPGFGVPRNVDGDYIRGLIHKNRLSDREAVYYIKLDSKARGRKT